MVTTAKLTSAENCSLRLGDIVDNAISDWTTPKTIMPVMGAPIRFTFEKKLGNIRSSAAALPVVAIKYAAFTIPVGTLVVFVIAAILAGIVAAIFPARRAGKLNVLRALQYE